MLIGPCAVVVFIAPQPEFDQFCSQIPKLRILVQFFKSGSNPDFITGVSVPADKFKGLQMLFLQGSSGGAGNKTAGEDIEQILFKAGAGAVSQFFGKSAVQMFFTAA